MWDLDTEKPLHVLEGHRAPIRSLAFTSDGRMLVSASIDNTMRLWGLYTGAPSRILEGVPDRLLNATFSPDGRLLITSSDTGIRIWSVAAALRGDEEACLAVIIPGRNGWAAYTPDGRYKLGGDATGLLGFTVGLCRFEPGELDAYPEAFDHPPRRIPDDEPLFTMP